MDITKLSRNPDKVNDSLVENGDRLITTKGCKIYSPVLYEQKGLNVIGSEISILGIYCIVVDDAFYGVSLAPTKINIDPSQINVISVDDEKYHEFVFNPGDTVIKDLMTVKDDTLPYYIYDIFIASGKVPFYFSYRDMGNLFRLAEYHAGTKTGANFAVMQMIVAVISRSQQDRTKYYRHEINSLDDIIKNPPAFISFGDVSYNATNTSARLIGSYFDQAATSALINPSQRPEKIETLLRM